MLWVIYYQTVGMQGRLDLDSAFMEHTFSKERQTSTEAVIIIIIQWCNC